MKMYNGIIAINLIVSLVQSDYCRHIFGAALCLARFVEEQSRPRLARLFAGFRECAHTLTHLVNRRLTRFCGSNLFGRLKQFVRI